MAKDDDAWELRDIYARFIPYIIIISCDVKHKFSSCLIKWKMNEKIYTFGFFLVASVQFMELSMGLDGSTVRSGGVQMF